MIFIFWSVEPLLLLLARIELFIIYSHELVRIFCELLFTDIERVHYPLCIEWGLCLPLHCVGDNVIDEILRVHSYIHTHVHTDIFDD